MKKYLQSVEEKNRVCEECKWIVVYGALDDNMDSTGELIYICALLDDEITLDHTCEEFDERPLF